MDFFLDESGNTGDLARTGPELDFGGQAIFSLAAIGLQGGRSLTRDLAELKKKHNVQASELKLSKILKRKPCFALDAINLLVKNDSPFFVEIVDKKHQLAVSITNGFICTYYIKKHESNTTVHYNKLIAEYLYHNLPNEAFFEFVKCMNFPSNERTHACINLIEKIVSQDIDKLAKYITHQIAKSKDLFYYLVEIEGKQAYKRFLPLPDINKREQAVWLLPNFSSFTNIYARINLFMSGKLEGTNIIHDEQAHFDEIIAAAKSQTEIANVSFGTFKPANADYSFKQISDLSFKASHESVEVQLADIVSGICMRWYQAHVEWRHDTSMLDQAISTLLHHSQPDRGVGINIVGPHNFATMLFHHCGC